jgi:hypothetical protein
MLPALDAVVVWATAQRPASTGDDFPQAMDALLAVLLASFGE